MSISEFNKIVDLGIKFGAYKIRITGGEPLLNNDLCQMLYLAKQKKEIKNLGVNTNGVLLSRDIVDSFSDIGIDSLVVGVDYFDSEISKNSKKGIPSKDILEKVLFCKRVGINVQIASTFDGSNDSDIFSLVKWCCENEILLKILELSSEEVAKSTSPKYIKLVKDIALNFNFKLGKTIPFNEYFGIHNNGTKVLFFHSHCRIRECLACANMHLRVTVDGYAKPCILRSDTEQNLLSRNNSENSMCKALHNLGNQPENPPI